MRNLLYKEFTLSIHPFFSWILPLVLSLLFLIPGWIYTIVFMYFFWISIPQIFQGYTAQGDQSFLTSLPVSKKSIAYSKVITLVILELIHLAMAAVVAVIHVHIHNRGQFFMSVNPALFGVVFLIFGLFNLVFLPGYFKTAHRYGLPLVLAVIVTLGVATFFEVGVMFIPALAEILKSDSQILQLGILALGVVIFASCSYVSARLSYLNYRRID